MVSINLKKKLKFQIDNITSWSGRNFPNWKKLPKWVVAQTENKTTKQTIIILKLHRLRALMFEKVLQWSISQNVIRNQLKFIILYSLLFCSKSDHIFVFKVIKSLSMLLYETASSAIDLLFVLFFLNIGIFYISKSNKKKLAYLWYSM